MIVTLPNEEIQGADLWELFRHRNVGNRPGHGYQGTYYNWPADRHLELMDDGPLQRALGQCNRRILALSEPRIPDAASEALQVFVDSIEGDAELSLMDLYRPIHGDIMYRLLFHEAPTRETLDVIDEAMSNYANTISGVQIRRRSLRRKAHAMLRERIDADATGFRDRFEVRDEIPHDLLCMHVYSALFSTATIQLTDLMAHCVLEICSHPRIEAAWRETLDGAEEAAIDHAAECLLNESLRKFPLIMLLTRVTTGPVTLKGGATLEPGTDLHLDLMRLERHWRDADRFCPQRWHDRSDGSASPFDGTCEGPSDVSEHERHHFLPFGIGPRSCPAAGLSMAIGTTLLEETFRRLQLATPPGYPHTRQLRRGVPVRVRRRSDAPLTEGPSEEVVRRHLPNDRTVSPGNPRSVLENLWHDITRSRSIRREFFCPAITYADIVLSKHGILK